MSGRSRPNLALSASAPCVGANVGAVRGRPALAAGGSDCSVGPLGVAGVDEVGLDGLGSGAASGGTEGISLGGRSIGVASKSCAPACCAFATSMLTAIRQTAKTSWPLLPTLVRTLLIRDIFESNRGKFTLRLAVEAGVLAEEETLAGRCRACWH